MDVKDDQEKFAQLILNKIASEYSMEVIRNLETIRTEQHEYARSIDELKHDHEEHKKMAAEKNKKLEKDIRSDLESLHTSDLITSLVGLVWLIVGITMSTLAPEIYEWLHKA